MTVELLEREEDPRQGWLIDMARDRDRWRSAAVSSRAALTDAHSNYRLALVVVSLVVVSLVFFSGGLVLGLVAAGLP